VLSDVIIKLLKKIDPHLHTALKEDIESFINNQMLTVFMTFSDRRLYEKVIKILRKHGGQSSKRMFKIDNKKQDRIMSDSSRMLICICLVIISHFKEEARKDQMNTPTPEYRCMSEAYKAQDNPSFEELVLSSVKLERLEFEVLVLESLIF